MQEFVIFCNALCIEVAHANGPCSRMGTLKQLRALNMTFRTSIAVRGRESEIAVHLQKCLLVNLSSLLRVMIA